MLASVQALATDNCKHAAHSSIGIDTIYKSKGKIPEVFFRGAGIPDNFIHYISSLAWKDIEYYSCSISYSSRDQVFAEQLHADLQKKGCDAGMQPKI
jgi:hypothetical protein